MVTVEDEDALQLWILQALREFTVSNPDVLSTFIMSLVRRESNEDALRTTCLEELQTFLKDETNDFVDLFIGALSGIEL